jgi:hypothetical protein
MRCVTYLCLHGIKVPGIFRVPANADTVSDCKRKLEAGLDIDLGGYWSKSGRPSSIEDVHVCASLLKTFFRELPKPILSHAAYTSIMRCSVSDSNLDNFASSMKNICSLLSKPNQQLLQYITLFLQYVLKHEEFNHMSATNLAIVWVPNLFRDEGDASDPSEELRMLPHAMRAALVMFTQSQAVFPVNEGTILPICFSQITGEALNIDQVLQYDVMDPVLSKIQVPVANREFDVKDSPISRLNSLRSSYLSESFNQDQAQSPVPRTLADLENLSIRELKKYLVTNGFDPSNCVEKNDLKTMALECFKSENAIKTASPPQPIRPYPFLARNSLRRSISHEAASRPLRTMEDRRTSSDFTFPSLFRSSPLSGGSSSKGTDSGVAHDPMVVPLPPPLARGSSLLGLLRRKSSLTRENMKDLSKSARGIGKQHSGSASSSPPSSPPFPPSQGYAAGEIPLEESARALEETPVFGLEAEEGATKLESQKRSWKIKDVDGMRFDELEALFKSYGIEIGTGRSEDELKEKAKQILLDSLLNPFFSNRGLPT